LNYRILTGFLAVALAVGILPAYALGPMVIGGDDLTDHGENTGSRIGSGDLPGACDGDNTRGWLYIENAVGNILRDEIRSGEHDVDILAIGSGPGRSTGCGDDDAGTAIDSAAFAVDPDTTVRHCNGAAEIDACFADLASGAVNPKMFHIAGSEADNDINSDAGEDPSEGNAINSHAVEIALFVNSGGGLLAHGSGVESFGWIATVLPGFEFGGDCENDFAVLTPAGALAFPLITNADIRSGPCHDSFSGNFGGLDVLAFDTFGLPFIVGAGAQVGKNLDGSFMTMFDSGETDEGGSVVNFLAGPVSSPFVTAIDADDCAAASAGSQALMPTPHPSWDPDLEASADAEWITSAPLSTSGSALFAHDFFMGPVAGAQLDFFFMIDNFLGGGPNEGLLINCLPVTGSTFPGDVNYKDPDKELGPFDITSLLIPNSVNTLFIVSSNLEIVSPFNNPSGIIYKAIINYNQCGPGEEFVPEVEPELSAQQDPIPEAGTCVGGPSGTTGHSGHEPPTIGKSLDGVRQVVNGGMSVDDQTWTVTQGYHQEFELLQMLSSPHTISNVIHCSKGVDYCNYIAVGFMGLTDDFNNPVMTVSATKDHLGSWTLDWYDPNDFISDPDDAVAGDIVFVPQIIDNKLLGTSFTIDFKNKDTGQLKMGIQVRDSYNGVRNFYFNEGVEFIDADAYQSVEAVYDEPVEVESVCFGQNNPDRNSCQFAKIKDWTTQNAEETLRQMMGNQYQYDQ